MSQVVIRNATVVDADTEVVDATGCLVTPGFIDPHTHFMSEARQPPRESTNRRLGAEDNS